MKALLIKLASRNSVFEKILCAVAYRTGGDKFSYDKRVIPH